MSASRGVSLDRSTFPASRRSFLAGSAAVGAGIAAGAGFWPREAVARTGRIDPPLEMDTKFATVVPVSTWAGGGAWAIVSKWGETFTLCNSGIIAGKDAVIVVDGFNTPGGAQWAAAMARQLTGRDPTHVVVTHYHFDHTDGLGGYLALAQPPVIISTVKTRELLAKHGVAGGGNLMFPAPKSAIAGLQGSVARCVLPDTVIEDSSKPLEIDIGGKSVILRDRSGHTPSDLNIEVQGGGRDGKKLVYAGDMIFNRIFPVYLDALPKQLRTNVAEVIGEDGGLNTIVPGHGALTTGAELKPFVELLDYIAESGKRAHDAGTSAQDAAKAFVVPEQLKDYTPGNPFFVQLAFEATYREIGGK